MEAPPKTSREPHILSHGTEKSVFRKDVFTLSQKMDAGQLNFNP
jgi:hypothetical protein